MSLKDLNLKGVYDSDEGCLLKTFYIPVLSESIKYRRIAGYFSSNAFAAAVKGFYKFIKKGGKIQLIANVVLQSYDQKEIKKQLRIKENAFLKEIDNIDESNFEEVLKVGHISLLGWLLKTEKLEIKIAVTQKGIEHKKLGILEDSENNLITFMGSDNETAGGWLHNDERFHVYLGWQEEIKEHFDSDVKCFDKLWRDKGNKVRVYEVSDAN